MNGEKGIIWQEEEGVNTPTHIYSHPLSLKQKTSIAPCMLIRCRFSDRIGGGEEEEGGDDGVAITGDQLRNYANFKKNF